VGIFRKGNDAFAFNCSIGGNKGRHFFIITINRTTIMIKTIFSAILIVSIGSFSLYAQAQKKEKKLEKATFGSGCFWCGEAVYELVNGIDDVEAGYSGGHVENPSYREVTSGQTGHVEVTRITYDPDVISYAELLEIFWHTHNPTTLNRQGNDVGEQYRSVIFYHNEEQKQIAEESLKKIEESGLWKDPIVTAIEPLKNYYVAENYHQDYFSNNPNAGYCSIVIAPKVKKFKKEFSYLLKEKVNQ
jgi:peptide-methionine (S)-S-oxide reductase